MRYAIYFAAEANDPLMQLGNSWLGRDPFSNSQLPQPDLDGITRKHFHELTVNPRRYGFHGTLKAPFTLAASKSEKDLVAACADFAGNVTPFKIGSLAVNRLGKFLALTPDQPEPALSSFAKACVIHFEPFRASLSQADLERRRQANLTPKQDWYVERWGYPYIFDEFRFHMTLSNKLDDEVEAGLLSDAAEKHFETVTNREIRCRHFGLYVEPERGAPFQVQSVFELTGQTPPQDFASQAEAAAAKEIS